jgi:hypothetical protein
MPGVGGQRSGNRRKAERSKVKGLCIDDCDRMEKYLINLKAYRQKTLLRNLKLVNGL